jgi:hypothetical protein
MNNEVGTVRQTAVKQCAFHFYSSTVTPDKEAKIHPQYKMDYGLKYPLFVFVNCFIMYQIN